jgi:uncharacterized protein
MSAHPTLAVEPRIAAPTFEINGFRPPWWLRNRHVISLWANRVQPAAPVRYRRERLATLDDDFVDLDWVDGEPDRPLVVGCHGLEGCSDSRYLRRLMAHVARRGWNGVALNYRSCSGEDNRQARAYHSGWTDDVALIVETLAARRPRRPIFVVAYSLGGNIVGSWLGRHADTVPPEVVAAFCCSMPFLLAPCSRQIERGVQRFYLRHFMRTLRQKAARKARAHPGAFDAAAAMRAQSLREFDEAFTCPLHGFRDADEYYAHASCGPHLARIRVPMLVLNALDDPLVPPHSTPVEFIRDAPGVRLVQTRHGGHVGFVCSGRPEWLEEEIFRWFAACGASRL